MDIDKLFKIFRENIVSIIGGLVAIFTPLLSHWINTKKNKRENIKLVAESDSIFVDSADKLSKSWENYANKIKTEYQELSNKYKELEIQVEKLSKDIKIMSNYIEEIEMVRNEMINFLNINQESNPENKAKIQELLERLINAKKP